MGAAQAICPCLVRPAHVGGDDDGCGHGVGLEERMSRRYLSLCHPQLDWGSMVKSVVFFEWSRPWIDLTVTTFPACAGMTKSEIHCDPIAWS
jgi:hypothetical protein